MTQQVRSFGVVEGCVKVVDDAEAVAAQVQTVGRDSQARIASIKRQLNFLHQGLRSNSARQTREGAKSR